MYYRTSEDVLHFSNYFRKPLLITIFYNNLLNYLLFLNHVAFTQPSEWITLRHWGEATLTVSCQKYLGIVTTQDTWVLRQKSQIVCHDGKLNN